MGRLLLTGFEPFGGDLINPSQLIVEQLDGKTIGSWVVDGMVLPVEYKNAADQVLGALGVGESHGENDEIDKTGQKYHVVISLGQAKGRSRISLERVAINVRDAGLPDGKGHRAIDEPVVAGGPVAYFSNLPLRTMMKAIEKVGVPVEISNTAGTYVCNDLLYHLLHFCHGGANCGGTQSASQTRVGVVHVPALPEQVQDKASFPSMPLEMIVRAVRAAIEALPVEDASIG